MQDCKLPQTLQEAVRYFGDPQVALQTMIDLRWPEGVRCPRCESEKVTFMERVQRWQCGGCRKQFSAKVGTLFEDSPLGLDRWLVAVWLIANDKNGIGSYEVARALGVTQKTAWFMLHRVRMAMQTETFEKLSGEVEVDETLIGDKARFRHADKKQKGRGGAGKAVVMGLIERKEAKGSTRRVRAQVVPDQRGKTLRPRVHEHVEPGATIYTDELASYAPLAKDFVHEAINHSETYVRGRCHTNNAENFWCLLKRAILGTYVSVEPWHLNRYLAEECFRYNEREGKDADRFETVLGNVTGKRLTYRDLIGEAVAGEFPS